MPPLPPPLSPRPPLPADSWDGGARVRFATGELGTWAGLGGITDRAVRLWLRAEGAGPATATLSLSGRVRAAARLAPSPATGGVAAADLFLDRPAPQERIEVAVAGLTRTARLAPAEGQPAPFAFAFGSCHEPFAPAPSGLLTPHAGAGVYAPLAREFRARGVRFLLLLGDQVYSDGTAPLSRRRRLKRDAPPPSAAGLVALYRRLYRGYFNEPGFRALLEEWPTQMTWDDHEIFDGWGSLPRPDDTDRRIFRAAQAVYREYQHLRHLGATPNDPPPYHAAFWYGDAGFFMLDLRSARDYRQREVLGAGQWRALRAFLEEAGARGCATVFVAASVPLLHFSPRLVRALEWVPDPLGNDVRDRWSSVAFRAERDAVLEALFAWQAARPRRQAVLLSGDVHVGAAFRAVPRRGRGLLRQWTSSPLSTPGRLTHHLVNRLGTSLVRWGEDAVEVARDALVTANNAGVVQVTPLPGGGHRLDLTLLAYRPRRQTTVPAARVTACPD